MNTATININFPASKRAKKINIEINAEQFERLAAGFGMFNPDFLESVARAERDYSAGRFRKIKSLKEIYNK